MKQNKLCHSRMKKYTNYTSIVILIGIILWTIRKLTKKKLTYQSLTPSNIKKSDSITCIKEDTYEEIMHTVIEPTIRKLRHQNYFTANDNISIYYEYYQVPNAIGTIVISHGFCEAIEKYKELIYYFTKQGYSVYGMDHRGHGRSTRMVNDNSLVHIECFDDYVNDFTTFVTKIVSTNETNTPLILYAHSMGGAIGTLFLERHPSYFKKAILSTPMMKVKLGLAPELIGFLIAKTMTTLGFGKRYVITQNSFDSVYNFTHSSASSEPRYSYFFQKRKENEHLRTYGSSYSWLKEAIRATHTITNKKNASKIKIPVLLFQTVHDTLVKPNGHYKFASYVPNVSFIKVKGTKHEIYNATNDILEPYINTIFEFLK